MRCWHCKTERRFTAAYTWLIPAWCAFLLLAFTVTSEPAIGASFGVNTFDDPPVTSTDFEDGKCETGPDSGICSLRAAMAEANGSAGGDIIALPAGTITVDYVLPDVGDVTISGAGAGVTVVKGKGTNAIFNFNLDSGESLTIDGLTIQNGMMDSGTVYAGCLGIVAAGSNSIAIRDVQFVGCDGNSRAGALLVSARGSVALSMDGVGASGGQGNDAGMLLLGTTGTLQVDATGIALDGNVGSHPSWYPRSAGLRIDGDVVATFNDLTIQGPAPDSGSQGPLLRVEGGASVIVNGATISGGVGGRGISVQDSELEIYGGEISGNEGGVYTEGSATIVLLQDVWIRDNDSRFTKGGGLWVNGGRLTLSRSLVSGNLAMSGSLTSGGGIRHDQGELILHNVTISGNQAKVYGGLYVAGDAQLTHVTVTDNTGGTAGGLLDNTAATGATLTVANSIIAGNHTGEDCYRLGVVSNLQSQGGNLVGGGNCPFDQASDQTSVDPLLGPLADNGGVTRTHALLVDSPAIDNGEDAACLTEDQRGETRPLDGDGDGTAACDSGAVEFRPAPVPDIVVTPTKITFPETTVGTISEPRGVTITNQGDAVLNVSDITLLDGTGFLLAVTDLGLGSDTGVKDTVAFCGNTAKALPAGESCFVVVAFQPGEARAYSTSLRVTSDDPDTSVVLVSLSGNGVDTGADSDNDAGNADNNGKNGDADSDGGSGGTGGGTGTMGIVFLLLLASLLLMHRAGRHHDQAAKKMTS